MMFLIGVHQYACTCRIAGFYMYVVCCMLYGALVVTLRTCYGAL